MIGKAMFGFIGLMLSASIALAQNCKDSIQVFCQAPVTNFSYSQHGASQVFDFASGEQKEIALELLAGKDYTLTLCADPEFNDVFSIVLQDNKGQVLYDNSTLNYQLHAEFSIKQHLALQLIVSAPEMNANPPVRGCVGVLVQEMNSIKIGFQE